MSDNLTAIGMFSTGMGQLAEGISSYRKHSKTQEVLDAIGHELAQVEQQPDSKDKFIRMNQLMNAAEEIGKNQKKAKFIADQMKKLSVTTQEKLVNIQEKITSGSLRPTDKALIQSFMDDIAGTELADFPLEITGGIKNLPPEKQKKINTTIAEAIVQKYATKLAVVGNMSKEKMTTIMQEAVFLYPDDVDAQRDFIKKYRTQQKTPPPDSKPDAVEDPFTVLLKELQGL